jgi:hypothetical protein
MGLGLRHEYLYPGHFLHQIEASRSYHKILKQNFN